MTEALPLVTLSVFTENHVGLLSRVTSAFTRRKVNIESLSVAASELPGIHRFTIVVEAPRDRVEFIARQLDKQVDVIKAFVHDDAHVLQRELIMVKLDARARRVPGFDALLRARDARVTETTASYLIVEKVGASEDATALVAALQPYGVLEVSRSGRVALTRPMRRLVEFLHEAHESTEDVWRMEDSRGRGEQGAGAGTDVQIIDNGMEADTLADETAA